MVNFIEWTMTRLNGYHIQNLIRFKIIHSSFCKISTKGIIKSVSKSVLYHQYCVADLLYSYKANQLNVPPTQAIKNKRYVSDTFGKKAKCYAIFLIIFLFLENQLSPMRFIFFFSFFLQPRLNVHVLCDIQKQKH